MQQKKELAMITLLMMISFASINALLFTPALPEITRYFSLNVDDAQLTMTWYLVGYTIGQLLYGPLANRYGRKPALYVGIILQIISSLICVLAGMTHLFSLLVIGRFLVALGSGVGLKMTFTLINEAYQPKAASRKMSYVMLAFAITPSLGVALGGLLTTHFGWMSCFVAGAVYGLILLYAVSRLPETQKELQYDAFKLQHLIEAYRVQFTNLNLFATGIMMGCVTGFVYVFAAVAPFIAINMFGMTSSQYGYANLIPSLGLIAGSLYSVQLTKNIPLISIIKRGVVISVTGVLIMVAATYEHSRLMYALFLPMIMVYFGSSMIMANTSSLVLSTIVDKAHGSAVMSFIYMGITTLAVLGAGLFPVSIMLLPSVFILLCVAIIAAYQVLKWGTSEYYFINRDAARPDISADGSLC